MTFLLLFLNYLSEAEHVLVMLYFFDKPNHSVLKCAFVKKDSVLVGIPYFFQDWF